ncbi:MAG: DnaA regulatory inactivator Hda [Rhodocyclales bacterium]|nr:DnaA regulatory inactivator Hda [Rhodocyclales bacterium]
MCPSIAHPKLKPLKQLILDVRPDFKATLDNFVPGDNAALVAALREHILRRDGSLLYLWGPPGSGRSHLLHAAAILAESSRPIVHSAVQAVADALVCIDDVEQGDEDELAALFRVLINARDQQQGIIVSGNAPPAALGFRADTASRIAQGLVFEMRPLSDEQKREALMQHAAGRGMHVSREIISYLLRHTRRDLPWLMAVLDALDEASLSLARPITLPLLREILRAE